MMRVIALLATTVACASAVTAQDSSTVSRGSLIRVTTVGGTVQPHFFHSVEGGWILAQQRLNGDVYRLSMDSILRIDVSRGRRVSPLGLGLGVVMGGVGGALAGCMTSKDEYGVPCAGSSSGPLIGGLVGAAGLGLAGGFLLGRPRWEPAGMVQFRPAPRI